MANPFAEFAPAKEEVNPFAEFAPKQEKPEEGNPFAAFAAKPEPKPEDQSFLRSVADVPLKAASGLATGVRLVADAFGAGSGVSNTIKGVEDYIGDLYSAQSKKDSAEISRIMKDAEDKGVGDQVKAAIKAFTVAPIDTVVNALGTSAPAIVAGLGASVLGAGALATTAVGAGVGSVMGAGTIKGSIYDAVKEELQKTEMPEEQIEARAKIAQEYGGKNLDQILMGAGLGAIGATTGFEPAVARQVAKQIATGSVKKQAIATAAKEFAGEAAEGGQEQLAQNIALQREGYDVPTMRGVVGQATLEGLAGAGLGATSGVREGLEARRIAAEKDMPVPSATPTAEEQPTQAAPVEERVVARAKELEAQGYQADDAVKVATRNIADEDAKARAPEVEAAVADVVANPERVAELTSTLQQEFNFSLAEAETTAVELATEEAKEDALAQADTAGEANVGQPIAEAGGVSPELAGQPDQNAPAAGVGEPTAAGMVPAGENVAPTVAGEAVEPTALKDKLVTSIDGKPWTYFKPGAEVVQTRYAGAPAKVIEAIDRPEGGTDYRLEVDVSQHPDGVDDNGERIGTANVLVSDDELNRSNPATQQPQGAQVGTETTEAVQAETQGQEPAPAAEVIEEAPAEEFTPQQIAQELIATEEAKAEEAPAVEVAPVAKPTKASKKAQDKANLKEVEELETRFASVSRPLTDAEIESMRAAREVATGADPKDLTDLVREHRLDKVKAINDILDMRERMKTASPEVKARLNDLINSPNISAQEYKDVVAGRALRAKYSAQLKAAEAPANTAFGKATNGAQALAIVIKTGDGFQKMLAKRILPFVRNVKFVVVEKGNEPDALKTEKGEKFWKNASGLFVQNDATGERTVYVAGDSYGELQGINNITVLHELLHAATNQKLYLGLKAIENGFSSNADLTKAVRELQDVMHRVQDYVMDNRGQLPPAVLEIIRNTNGMVITDLREFLAYGMSDPDFQEFMMNVQGVEEDVSFFSRFVAAIREFFKMGEDTTNALTDLIVSTDRLLSAQKDARMRFLEAGDKALAQRGEAELKMSQQTITKSTQKKVDKLTKSSFADNLRDGFPALAALRGQTPIADELNLRAGDFKLKALQQLLPSLQTETLVQWATRIDAGGGQRGIPGIAESWQATGDMVAMRTKFTNAMGKINDKLSEVSAKAPDQYKQLADVMHLSTLLSKDPATNKTNPALNRMWDGLTDANKALYEDIRDFYKNSHELYHSLLDEQLEASTLPQEAKSKLMASIKKMYEDGKKLYPYFPLMRYGQFWVRVGKGKEGEFHMFESSLDRDRFVLERVRQMNESGDTRSKAEMMKDLDIDEGNDLTSARRRDDSASDMLKQIFNTIDASKKDGDVKSEALKDEIYQLYLQTLPDRNFRRQYLKRQGKAGFSGDIQRNFINMGTNTAAQLARIKYGPTIMGQLERAEASLVGNPDKARLGEFVSEMRIRAEQQVRPDPENGVGFELAKLANTSAFLWMMTSVKTMATQFTSIPIFVAPVLASKHGTAKTAAALGKALNVFNGIGIVGKDGKYTPPSMENLKGLTADEKAAMQYMVDRGLSDNTMAFELGNRRDMSTAAYNNPVRAGMRQVSNAMTAMFHHAERLIREVTFITSYRLNREKLGNTPGAHEKALRLAEAESHEALNNYHGSNRPRGILANKQREVMLDAHKPLGRAVLQFKMYPAFVTTYFVRNFYRMTNRMEDPQVRKEARIQFLGSLGMSMSLAGYIGIPGISFAMGIIQGLLNGLRGDDDDDELEGRDLEFWIRNKWMPETFGNVKIGGKGLDEILDRGVVAALTGYDITSSLSMNNMWFPEQKEQATAVGEMQSFLLSLAGPGASLATTQIPKAIDYFNQGKILQGMEQLSPALFRGGLTAVRYGQEGATTSSGAVIKEPNEFTAGQLLAQSAGFVTDGLQAKREAIFKLQGEIMKVKQERTKILDRLDLEINKGSDEDVEKAFEKVYKFNSRNPMDAIDNDNIRQSLKKQMERRMMSDRGFPIDKKYYPFVVDLLGPSSAKLDREAAK